jgi:peroxiredoxin
MVRKIVVSVLLAITALFLCTTDAGAKDGYKIQLKFTDIKDTLVYLAHYYGKPLPTIYKSDSVRLDKNGAGVLQSNTKLVGGIYIILLSDKRTYFDFLLDNGADITITTSIKDIPLKIKFNGSPENERFVEYGNFLTGFGNKQQAISDKLITCKTNADSQAVYKEMQVASKELTDYRKAYIAKYPNTLFAKIFGALSLPEVPQGLHYLPDGKVDSAFGYMYYKAHYWDGFDFNEDRLINTPVYDTKLDEYINKLCYQHEDTIIKEANILLAKAKNSTELFKYTLWWLTYNAENSKVMGMDAVFVYLVENYYMKGAATWLTSDELQKYYDGAQKIAPNVLGNIAPELKMKDINNVEQSLHGLKAKYTLLIFWSPDCGHCQQEIPKIDSLYKAKLKKQGLRVYAVSTLDNEKQWKDYIKEHHLEDWTHVWDVENKSRFRSLYNVYMTPILYLLDEKKIIRGKRLDYLNIADVMEMLERKAKTNTK